MSDKKKAQEIADDLEELFNEMINSYTIEDFYPHFCAELRVEKKHYDHNLPSAISAEKIAALEKAVEEFKMVYEAELAEARKMPLSWHEARRVMKLFEEAREPFSPPPDTQTEH